MLVTIFSWFKFSSRDLFFLLKRSNRVLCHCQGGNFQLTIGLRIEADRWGDFKEGLTIIIRELLITQPSLSLSSFHVERERVKGVLITYLGVLLTIPLINLSIIRNG